MKPISLELCCKASGESMNSSLASDIISIQRSWRADRINASPEEGFLATEFQESEVHAIYDSGGNFFYIRSEHCVLGFVLTTSIEDFTSQLGSPCQGRLEMSESLNLANFLYLYQVAVLKGEQRCGLGRLLVQEAQRYHSRPILADVLSWPVPNLGSRAFLEKLGFRKVGNLQLDNYRDYGALASDILVDTKIEVT